MPKLVRADIVPGAELVICRDHVLLLDPHLQSSFGLRSSYDLPTRIRVLTKPRRLTGANLVRIKVRVLRRVFSAEVYYCDILNRCEAVKAKKFRPKKPVVARIKSRYERLLSVDPFDL